jgi:hypothetical protein
MWREANDSPKTYTLEVAMLERRGPRVLDDLTTLHGEKLMTNSKLAFSSSPTLGGEVHGRLMTSPPYVARGQ